MTAVTVLPSGMPKLMAVILNTNRRSDTLDCLESLKATGYPSLRILVLDNRSTDGSVEAIRSKFPGVEIHSLKANRGYAGNNNVGIRMALEGDADWVLVLNEDVVLGQESISRMLAVGEEDDTVGVVGPMVYHHDEPGVIQSAGGGLGRGWQSIHAGQNQQDRGQYAEPRRVDWISGCALLARCAMIEEIGELDERFFYYWEETEWCLRARRAGWSVVFVPDARVWHKGVQSCYAPGPNVTYYWARNWLMMLAKLRAPPSVWIVALAVLGRNLLAWSVRPKWRSRRPHRDALWQGIMDFLRGRTGVRPQSGQVLEG